jgi:hypothetical protein
MVTFLALMRGKNLAFFSEFWKGSRKKDNKKCPSYLHQKKISILVTKQSVVRLYYITSNQPVCNEPKRIHDDCKSV